MSASAPLLRPRPPAHLIAAALALLAACGPKAAQPGDRLFISGSRIIAMIAAPRDTVFDSASQVFVQERIQLRRFQVEDGLIETDFIDLARYPSFDPEIWDATERLVKLMFDASGGDSTTVLICEPLYNPYEVFTGETEYARLSPVPPGHPGFDIAAALTRRIAAHAERRVVTAP